MKDKIPVNEQIFRTLKKQDDDIRKQVLEMMKKPTPNKNTHYLKDSSMIQSPFKGESEEDSSGNTSLRKKLTNAKFNDDTMLSEIKQ